MLHAQIRFTNIRANKSLGVPDDVFAALSRHMDAGRGRVVDSMSTALLERQRKLKLGASPTSGGAPGGSGKNKRQPSEKRRERSRKKRRSTQPQCKHCRSHTLSRSKLSQPREPKGESRARAAQNNLEISSDSERKASEQLRWKCRVPFSLREGTRRSSRAKGEA